MPSGQAAALTGENWRPCGRPGLKPWLPRSSCPDGDLRGPGQLSLGLRARFSLRGHTGEYDDLAGSVYRVPEVACARETFPARIACIY